MTRPSETVRWAELKPAEFEAHIHETGYYAPGLDDVVGEVNPRMPPSRPMSSCTPCCSSSARSSNRFPGDHARKFEISQPAWAATAADRQSWVSYGEVSG